MAGEIGKSAAEALKGKLEIDEQNKLRGENNDTYDAQVFASLHEKVAAEIMSFNEQAQAANQLKLEKGSSMLQFFRDNKPAFAVLVKDRSLHFLDAASSAPTQSLQVAGSPEEYAFQSRTAGTLSEEDLLKGLIRLAAGAKLQAK